MNTYEDGDLEYPEYRRAKIIKRVIIWYIVALVCILVYFVMTTIVFPVNVTLEQYNQVKIGMTLKETTKILGDKYTVSAESGNSTYATRILSWKGRGTLGANVIITFQGGVVISKAQAGLW